MKKWNGLFLLSPQKAKTFAKGTTYPCIEAYQDNLYLIERLGTTCSKEYDDLSKIKGDEIYLSKLDPSGKQVHWEKVFAESPGLPYCYQGLCDTAILNGKLYLMWTRQHTGKPEFKKSDSRQILKCYDFEKEGFSKEIIIEPSRKENGTWEGGITVWNNEIWMSYLEVSMTGYNSYSTELIIAPLTHGKSASTYRFGQNFSPHLYSPFPAAYKGELIIFFSDLQYCCENLQYEPLYYVKFDGKKFSDPILINNNGRNRYAKGLEYHDRLVVAYKSNARYIKKHDYLYHDIALSIIDGEEIETTCYTQEKYYYSGPHLAHHNENLLLSYTKIKDGSLDGYKKSYGTFIGKLLAM